MICPRMASTNSSVTPLSLRRVFSTGSSNIFKSSSSLSLIVLFYSQPQSPVAESAAPSNVTTTEGTGSSELAEISEFTHTLQRYCS